MNFAVIPRSPPIPTIIANIEEALKSSRIIGTLNKQIRHNPNLSPDETKALKELRSDNNIIILKSDKGNATVVMDRRDYESKLSIMLNDTSTYKKLNRDSSAALERKMNSLLLQLNRSEQIPDRLYQRLRSSSRVTSRIYGLPKVHKSDVPLRPIISFYTSPTYQLSRHLSTLLTPLVGKSPSHVRNSRDFVNFITEQQLNQEVLVSFDVVSLFTNVPTDLAVRVAKEKLEQDDTLHEHTYLDLDNIISLLELCLNATYLQFQQNVYQQIQGTAMGSPVSVTVAILVMEERALESFHTPILFWKRYVDDTCTAILPELLQEFHQHLNSIEPSIQFTCEVEEDGQPPSWMFYYQKKMTVVSQHRFTGSPHTLTTIFTSVHTIHSLINNR